MPFRSTFERILGQEVVAKALGAVICGLFRSTLSSEIPSSGEIVVAIDGKTLRDTIPKDHTHGVHLMAAYLPKEGLVLAQIAVDGKTNEITATPQLLAQLDLRGMVVVGDAMQCQRELSAGNFISSILTLHIPCLLKQGLCV